MTPPRTDRRRFLAAGGALLLPAAPRLAFARSAPRIVVVGGGFAGTIAARYVLRWLPGAEVTLVEPNAQWVSCPLSNRIFGPKLSLRELTRGYEGLAAAGIRVVADEARSVNPSRREVALARAKAVLPYDRLVVAPGVDFDMSGVEGLEAAIARGSVVHAWKAGPQTALLKKQVDALRPGGVIAMHVPKVPYRCPPGPYERASMLAFYLKSRNPKAKVLLFDANPDIQSKRDLFLAAWKARYEGMIEYVPNADLKAVDAARGELSFEMQGKVAADVMNVIPPQRAGAFAREAGLADAGGRWCGVDFLTYESKAVPGVHVLGDSVAAAPGMPKSGHMANQQAKVCAGAIASILGNQPLNDEPIIANTCYSFVDDKQVIHVASVHHYDREKRTMLPAKGAGGLSEAPSQQEAMYAFAWGFNLMEEMFA
ncbi:MAG TPA: NAD(P)/FAD-dependent oxidoreductase [Usitatibacteraceae bacterium]|mgnify:CR=1 FL=1|nr:NAD(P)/FAD-dependent oxidoreductase [Usitatibacteraceae bacterium]HQY47002.1 NAD(P)/FAD-dependent oxidoreductase [Usitatibacteraceae bacterium]HRA23997.1 NAD(P)/FAD-dependent oxidoreductase [Usitatibacteraceae bacterium]